MKPCYIIVHHTGAEEKDAEQVRRYHLSLGWRDVGYNYIIERSGRVVGGRPLDIPGAHCRAGGMNRQSIGVAVIGNMDKHDIPPQQRQGLLELLRELAQRYNISRENVLGHREVPGAATACPGRFLDMDWLRRKLGGVAANESTIPVLGHGHSEQEKETTHLWRVQVGAFSTRTGAQACARQLHQKGIDAFVVEK